MEILKAATEWAKAEVFSSRFFILFGVLFITATFGFWQLGKTELAKAFIFSTLVAGILLMAVGLGIFFTNKARVTSFEVDYNSDQTAFIEAEMIRTQKTIDEFSTIVFKVIPFLIVAAALVFAFVDRPLWRAISITTIAMMVVILWVDSNANARIEAYRQQLQSLERQQDTEASH